MIAGTHKGQAAIECRCGATARPLRAQAAIEAMSYGGFFLLVFVGAVFVFLQLQSQDLTRAENAYAQQVAYSFADSVHVAEVAGPGFWQHVDVQPSILGRQYTMTISRPSEAYAASERQTGFVYVDWLASNGRMSSASAPTITTKYGLTSGQGINVAPDTGFINISSGVGRFKMENRNGTIWISKN